MELISQNGRSSEQAWADDMGTVWSKYAVRAKNARQRELTRICYTSLILITDNSTFFAIFMISRGEIFQVFESQDAWCSFYLFHCGPIFRAGPKGKKRMLKETFPMIDIPPAML